jgi:hypothetical protein
MGRQRGCGGDACGCLVQAVLLCAAVGGWRYVPLVTRRRPTYQTEPLWLRQTIWARGHVEPWELLQISAWKSANANLALLSLNTPADIVSVTSDVLTALGGYRGASSRDLYRDQDEWARLQVATQQALRTDAGLRSLHGVRLPVASAVLSILNPELWPIVDVWAIQGTFSPTPPTAWHNEFDFYWAYVSRLAELQQQQELPESLHGLDQRLYNAMRQGEEPPFERVPAPVRRRRSSRVKG